MHVLIVQYSMTVLFLVTTCSFLANGHILGWLMTIKTESLHFLLGTSCLAILTKISFTGAFINWV